MARTGGRGWTGSWRGGEIQRGSSLVAPGLRGGRRRKRRGWSKAAATRYMRRRGKAEDTGAWARHGMGAPDLAGRAAGLGGSLECSTRGGVLIQGSTEAELGSSRTWRRAADLGDGAAELGPWDAGKVAVRARRLARGRAMLRGAHLPYGSGVRGSGGRESMARLGGQKVEVEARFVGCSTGMGLLLLGWPAAIGARTTRNMRRLRKKARRSRS